MKKQTMLMVGGVLLMLAAAAWAGGNVTNYRVALEHLAGDVVIGETHGGRSLSMYHHPHGRLEVRVADTGEPTMYMVTLGDVTHWDLSGNGHIDARSDRQQRRSEIWVDDRWVHVRESKATFLPRVAVSVDGATTYDFTDGAWSAR